MRRRLALAAAGALGMMAAGLWALDRALPPDLSRVEHVGTEVLDRAGRTVALLPAPGGVWRFRAGAGTVPREFVDVLVRTEDRRFWVHPGVDPLALARAAVQWARAGHVVSGGSTLAMQAARLLEPRPRTVRSKAIEIARALQLEWRYGREGVLGIWLTLAPYGGNLEGVRAGAQAWFGVTPGVLSPAQAALLVALPRRPEALRPDRHAAAARRVRDRVLASEEAVPEERIAFPRHAGQAVVGIVSRLPALGQAGPSPRPSPEGEGAASGSVRTTLDLPLQAALERLAAERAGALPERASLAVLIADAPSREIRALVSGAGALDLTRAVRSPGSALKPVLYALAFQEGLARPDTLLTDLPRHFGGYAPEDFDHGHAGAVTAADALRRSLNLPAVALLDRLGPLRFVLALRGAGAGVRLPPGADASLPLALGGAGITMRDLAGLYAALATDGAGGALRLVPGALEVRPLVQPAAAHLVADILTQRFPEGGPAGIAWKTGTSWGGRDAWAVGFDRRHVVAVWLGRPDGTPLPGATGRGLALPLLSRVFDLLPPAPRDLPAAAPVRSAAAEESTLRLLFPPPGAVLDADGPVALRAMGGRRPLTFLVDGSPVPGEPARRQASWEPPGPGFYAVTVLDAEGATARAGVRVR